MPDRESERRADELAVEQARRAEAPPDVAADPEQEERDRAGAVSSVPDETRVHADADETELVQDAGGELRNVEGEQESDDE